MKIPVTKYLRNLKNPSYRTTWSQTHPFRLTLSIKLMDPGLSLVPCGTSLELPLAKAGGLGKSDHALSFQGDSLLVSTILCILAVYILFIRQICFFVGVWESAELLDEKPKMSHLKVNFVSDSPPTSSICIN